MTQRTRLNVASRLKHITETQAGYFTRAQADSTGVADFELERAVDYEQIARLSTGIYRLVGAPVDPHQQLRVAWLRLTSAETDRMRLRRPSVWVSHRSAAITHGFGDYATDVPEFIAIRRIQPRFEATIRVRSAGLERSEWVVRDGFVLTSPARTFADLAAGFPDGGHLGRYAQDALNAGAANRDTLQAAIGNRLWLPALLEMAEK